MHKDKASLAYSKTDYLLQKKLSHFSDKQMQQRERKTQCWTSLQCWEIVVTMGAGGMHTPLYSSSREWNRQDGWNTDNTWQGCGASAVFILSMETLRCSSAVPGAEVVEAALQHRALPFQPTTWQHWCFPVPPSKANFLLPPLTELDGATESKFY